MDIGRMHSEQVSSLRLYAVVNRKNREEMGWLTVRTEKNWAGSIVCCS